MVAFFIIMLYNFLATRDYHKRREQQKLRPEEDALCTARVVSKSSLTHKE